MKLLMLATKRDLEDVRKDLSAEIASVKRDISDVRKDMEALTDKLLIKVTKVIIGCVGLGSNHCDSDYKIPVSLSTAFKSKSATLVTCIDKTHYRSIQDVLEGVLTVR